LGVFNGENPASMPAVIWRVDRYCEPCETALASGVWRLQTLFFRVLFVADMLISFEHAGAIQKRILWRSEIIMKLRMHKTLNYWVDVAYEKRKWEAGNPTKAQLVAEILQEFEQRGDAMRHLNANGKIAWKSSPMMLMELADAEREVEADLADFP
jgi:hypothetical protein